MRLSLRISRKRVDDPERVVIGAQREPHRCALLRIREFHRPGEELGDLITERFQISCHCECGREVFIRDITVATHLYRIAQEAISNAIKHGQARRIRLRLETSGNIATLTIQDDGRGLPVEWRQSRGMGLHIMAHRATMIGAKFAIDPVPEGGTRVRCAVPHSNP